MLNTIGYTDGDLTSIKLADLFKVRNNDKNPLNSEFIAEGKFNGYITGKFIVVPVEMEIVETSSNRFICSFEYLESESDNKTIGVKSKQEDVLNLFELRTVINNLAGFIDLLSEKESIQNDSDSTKYLTGLVKNVRKLKELFNIAENDASKLLQNKDVIIIKDFVKHICDQVQRTVDHFDTTLNLISRLEDNYSIEIDERLLSTILSFFISKAMNFTRKEEITIILQEDKNKQVIKIEIDDLGKEIPTEIIEHVIENKHDVLKNIDFLTDRYSEYVDVFRNMRKLNMSISILNSQSTGVSISLSIPVAAQNEDNLDKNLKETWINTILIVDDNRFTTYILKTFLSPYFDVEMAFSGNEALNIIDQKAKSGSHFDVVFMDLELPRPWDGVQLTREIRSSYKEYKNTPFIVQTATSPEDPIMDKVRNNNFFDIIEKPFEKNRVFQSLTNLRSYKPY